MLKKQGQFITVTGLQPVFTETAVITAKTTVINVRDHKAVMAAVDAKRYVYVGRGRGGRFGNPFSSKDDTLAQFKVAPEEVLPKYEAWLKEQPDILKDLPSMKGMALGCFCRPAKGFQGKVKCHAQILAAMIDGIKPEEVE